jgi:thiazole synthase ThiGH ThiG subunit
MERFQGWAKEHGVSQAAFEALAKDYIDMEMSSLEQYKVDVQAEKEKLGPDADQIIKSTAEWANGLFNKGVFNEEELEAFKQSAGTAAGIRAMQKLRRFYGEAKIPVAQPSDEGVPTVEELYAMVGKPEYQSDPAFRSKVQKWFKVRFPDNPDTDYII